MSLLDRVKERSGSDLSDDELEAIILAIAAELDARLGPVGPVTVHLGDPADPNSRFYHSLRVTPPIGAGDVTIVELDPGNSGDPGAETILLQGDYRVLHDGRTIQRLTSGPNGRTYWAPLVRITYTPAGASQPARDEALIKIAMIDLSYRGGLKSERAGDYSFTLSGDPVADREAVFAGLVPASGFLLA
ncbi:head-tail connector protein [Sphingopyxis macrogoltabida]|uniref:Uncharacterized protein n=1 Tax=Sphingopyxis macrogoltabida TaxID=33050 RepID=A0AAC9AVT2_SPHMC|nr:hypothetical protein [Sphingopyxis macrogoltabida]ALJ14262.1 hypothetical protein LH19_15435 [Sphingopyxis macrogoltabida]AMU90527.1 hypothetical protein ATM17_16005 [Sphingopyxis macrogoltabida]